MSKVIEQDGCLGRRKIDLIYPSVFTACLSLDEPSVMQQLPVLDERIEMKALRHSLDRHPAISVRRLLFWGRTRVKPEIVEAVATKDRRARQRRHIMERVAVDTQFPTVPETGLASVDQPRQE
jgi:hypothetical protein